MACSAQNLVDLAALNRASALSRRGLAECLAYQSAQRLVIFASKASSVSPSLANCALNSNLDTGGGTDDTARLQAILDFIAAAGGGRLVIDGVALISSALMTFTAPTTQYAALMVGSNTTIQCPVGCGVFLANGSNCTMLSNKHITGLDTPLAFDHDITLLGGTWNGNWTNQGKFENDAAEGMSFLVLGVWFGGIQNLTLAGVTVRNACNYSVMVSNGSGLTMADCVLTQDEYAGLTNKDGLHFWGSWDGATVTNLQCVNLDDDVLALNTDEGVQNYATLFSSVPFVAPRCPRLATQGALTNFLFDGISCVNCSNGPNLYAMGYGSTVIDRATFMNIAGTAGSFSLYPFKSTGLNDLNRGILPRVGTMLIENWAAEVNSALNLSGANLTLRGITYQDPASTPLIVGGGVTLDRVSVLRSAFGISNAVELNADSASVQIKNSTFANVGVVLNLKGHQAASVGFEGDTLTGGGQYLQP